MKLVVLCFFVLASLTLWFGAQGTPPSVCRGKPLPITLLPGPKMTGPELPLRFGGTRPFPRSPINSFPSEKSLRLVIKSRDEFSDFWKRLTARVEPENVPPLPEVDFTKEMLVVSAMGVRPNSGYGIFIDGACEVDGQIEVFVNNVENPCGYGTLQVLTSPADAVRLPRSDLPVVFRETQISCTQWQQYMRFPRSTG